MEIKVGLVDYGMGNLFSVQKAFERINQPLILIQSPEDFINCDALILPGVGAFDPAMQRLEQKGMIPFLKSWNKEKKPMLGICLGLQLLFETSDEGNSKGLGLIKGHVHRLPRNQNERIPHMGWAVIKQKEFCPLINWDENTNWVYFVHSFAAHPSIKKDQAATTIFGDVDITAIIWKERLGACQFHPEKSGETGEKMLDNWLKWIKNGAPI